MITAAQVGSLPALYRMKPSRYKVARKILSQLPPLTLVGLETADLDRIETGAQVAGRTTKRHFQARLVAGYGPRHSGCLTVW